MNKRIGLIGFGALSRSVVDAWMQAPVEGYTLVSVLVRPHQHSEACRYPGAVGAGDG